MKTPLLIVFLFVCTAINSQHIYVNRDAVGTNDGSSWENAYLNLQNALSDSEYGDTLWIAKGVYFPTTSSDRNVSFQIPDGVVLYGGFYGSEESLNERNWEENETILSGDIGTLGDSADNSYTVVSLENTSNSTAIDGFIITNGNANGTSIHLLDKNIAGGGVYILSSNNGLETAPRISNCTIHNNFANDNGAGLMFFAYDTGGRIRINISDCVIKNNTSNGNGAGIGYYAYKGSEIADTISNTLFTNNIASNNGGGISYSILDETIHPLFISGSTFSYGQSKKGSGLYYSAFYATSQIRLENCIALNHINQTAINDSSTFSVFHINSPLSHVEVRNSTLTRNYVQTDTTSHNIGLWISSFDIKISDCNFEENDIGAFLQAQTEVTGSTFHKNKMEGVIILNNSTSIISSCTFTENQIGLKASDANINKSLFTQNLAKGFLVDNVTVGNSLFQENAMGGGTSTNAIVVNCIFLNNLEEGALTVQNADIYNSIFSGNVASNNSSQYPDLELSLGEINVIHEGNTNVSNCIFSSIDSCGQIGAELIPYPDTSYFIVPLPDGQLDTIATIIGDTPSYSISCDNNYFSTNPLFTDPQNNNFHLLPISPAIDAGYTPIINSLDISTDFEGNPRVLGNSVDIGLYEDYRFHVSIDSINHVSCEGDLNGNVTLLEEGIAPFSYNWNTGEASGEQLDSLPAGMYTLTVTDSYGKSEVLNFEIEEPLLLNTSFIVDPLECHGEENAQITAVPQGGTLPYYYSWESGETIANLQNIGPGAYRLTVTDANNCTSTGAVILMEPDALSAEIEVTNVSCFGASDGSVQIDPAGGTPPFQIQLNSFSSLSPGEYSFNIIDDKDCSEEFSFSITEPDSLLASATILNATSPTTADGAITLESITGGMPPYSFLWSNGEMEQNLINVLPGIYELSISDFNGCQIIQEYEVSFSNASYEHEISGLTLNISPNPQLPSENVALTIISKEHKTLHLRVFERNGALVYKDKFNANGKTKHQIDKLLVPGLYLIKIEDTSSGRYLFKKIVIQ